MDSPVIIVSKGILNVAVYSAMNNPVIIASTYMEGPNVAVYNAMDSLIQLVELAWGDQM